MGAIKDIIIEATELGLIDPERDGMDNMPSLDELIKAIDKANNEITEALAAAKAELPSG